MHRKAMWTIGFAIASGVMGFSWLDGRAEEKKIVPLRVEDAVSVREFGLFSPPSISPDGASVAYVVQRKESREGASGRRTPLPGSPWFGEGGDVIVLNVATGQEQILTGGIGNNWLPVWSPDGQYVAFLSDRETHAAGNVWLWQAKDSKLSRLSDLPVTGDQIVWTPDSGNVIVVAAPDQVRGVIQDQAGPVNRENGTSSISNGNGATVNVYLSSAHLPGTDEGSRSDPWSLGVQTRTLMEINVRSRRASALVHNVPITCFSLSPNGARIIYASPTHFEKQGSQQILYDLVVLEVSSKLKRVLASDVRFDYNADSLTWSLDNRHFCFRTGGPLERANDCYVGDAEDGTVRRVSDFPDALGETPHRSLKPLWDGATQYIYFIREGAVWRSLPEQRQAEELARVPDCRIIQLIANARGVLWTPDGGKSTRVLVRDDIHKEDKFYRIELTGGESAPLLARGECYSCASEELYVTVSNDGRSALYFAEDAGHAPDLQLAEADFQNPKQITHLNPQFGRYQMGAVRLIDWLSDDGQSLHGALLLPAGYENGKRYPLIVYVYAGGLLSNNLDRFGLGNAAPFNMQLFSTRGYAVLLPDSPQQVGTPMLDTTKTVLPGVNRVIQMGIADPGRIGLMGHSNGGYATLALLVQTNRFEAAIEVDGASDLLTFYGEMRSDGTAYGTALESGFDSLGGTPWQLRERYAENSPFFYLDRVNTPLLIIHGGDDLIVDPFLGDQLFVGLRRLGKEAQYVKYRGEGHSPSNWNYANKVDFVNRMLDWFDTHCKARMAK
jgi:dipeptidyl aminopeptidase/acylaminoacyl peptidase